MKFSAKFLWVMLCGGVLCASSRAQAGKSGEPDRIVVKIDGKPLAITNHKHKPYFSIGSLDELRKYYDVVKPYLPKMPFKMEGQWVIPGKNGNIRTFRDFPEFGETFSQNGDYVALIAPDTRDADYQVASPEFYFMTTDYEWIWRTLEGPTWVYILNDGRIINRQNYPGPMDLRFYDCKGTLVRGTGKVFSYDPGGEPSYILWLPQHELLVTRKDNEAAAIDFQGEILWHHIFPEVSKLDRHGLEMGVDPQGRGLYVILDYEKDQTLKFIDPKTGEISSGLWEHEKSGAPKMFSPDGHYAVMAGGVKGYILDWSSGQALFPGEWKQALAQPNNRVELTSLSSNPLRLAFRDHKVDNASAKEIWELNLEDAGNYWLKLSDDGKTAAAVLEKKDGHSEVAVTGILLYKIEE